MRTVNRTGIIALLGLLLLPLCASAQDTSFLSRVRPAPPFPTRGKFVWTDLCAGPAPWEVHGHRIVLIHDPEFDDVTIEFDEGWDSDVVHSPRVLFDPKTGDLTFSYSDFRDEYLFKGKVTSYQLAGAFDDDEQNHTISRVPNSWPDQPPCPTPTNTTAANSTAPTQTAQSAANSTAPNQAAPH